MTQVPTPLGDLTAWMVVAANVVGWVGWMLLVGWAAHRAPLRRFDHDTWLTRPRSVERDGRWYEARLHIVRWKDWLPEGGGFYRGGFAKRTVAGGDVDVMRRFVAETRRAEYAHWLMMAATPVFFLWNAWWGDVLNVVFALTVNLPCLMVQRYNRARLTRVIRRRDSSR